MVTKVDNTKEEKDWIKLLNTEVLSLLHLSWDLEDLAKAFLITGNETVGLLLSEWSSKLRQSSDNISEATCICTTRGYKDAQASSAAIIATALAVIGKQNKA